MNKTSNALSGAQLLRSALIVLVGFLASGVFGFVRVAIVGAQFGTSDALDAFTAAQRLPELVFNLVAGGALGSSFIPVYARLRERDSAQAWQLASAVMTLSALGALMLGGVVALFAKPIVTHVLFAGRDTAAQELTANMMRLMMITPFIFSISGLVMGILQSHGLFFFPSLAASMNSLGVIVGALVLAPALTPLQGVGQVGANNVYGLAYGAILSALLHLLVQLRGLWLVRARLRLSLDWRMEGVLSVLRLMLPRVLGLAVVQLNFVVNIALASRMPDGSLTALSTAFQLVFFALGIIAQSVGSAVFPTLAALRAEGDMAGFRVRLVGAVRSVVFLALPASVVFLCLGEGVVAVFERGQWTLESTQATAWALGFYALGLVGFGLLEVLSRAFYALEDTWTPVIVGVAAMLSNIALSLLFVRFIGETDSLTRGAFAGLALANALTTNVEAAFLWVLLRRKTGALGDVTFWRAMAGMAGATLITGVGAWAFATSGALTGVPLLLAGGMLAGALYGGACLLLRLPEATLVPSLLLRRLKR